MVWTHSACSGLKSREQQLTQTGEEENYKHFSLLFRGYKRYQLMGKSALSNVVSLVQVSVGSYFFPRNPDMWFWRERERKKEEELE